MEFVFLAILVATGVGIIIGEAIRRLAFRRLKGSHIQKPQYQIEDDLTPAEFGCIIDGKVGEYELLGELVQLHQRGIVRLARDHAGRITVVRTLSGTGALAEVDKILLKAVFRGPAKPVVLRDLFAMADSKTIEYATLTSLQRKGWMRPTKFKSSLPPGRILWTVIISQAVLLAITGVGYLLGLSGAEAAWLNITLAAAVCVAGGVFCLFLIAKKEVTTRTAFVMHTSQTFKDRWHLVHGVYVYLLVSGNDIFTPDYEKLELEKMDALYPYAIAAHVEKGLLRSL